MTLLSVAAWTVLLLLAVMRDGLFTVAASGLPLHLRFFFLLSQWMWEHEKEESFNDAVIHLRVKKHKRYEGLCLLERKSVHNKMSVICSVYCTCLHVCVYVCTHPRLEWMSRLCFMSEFSLFKFLKQIANTASILIFQTVRKCYTPLSHRYSRMGKAFHRLFALHAR